MKKRIIAGIVGWLGVNLFLIFPILILLTTDVPQQVELEVIAPQKLSIKVNDSQGVCRSRDVGASAESQKVRFFLPCDFDGRRVSASTEGDVPFYLCKLSIVQRFVLARDYRLLQEKSSWLCIPDGAWRIAVPTRLLCAAVVGEVLFLGLALLICVAKKSELAFNKQSIWVSFVIAGVASFFVVVIVPLQSVLANATLYRFSLAGFLFVAIAYALIGTLVLGLGLILSCPVFGYFVHSMLLSVVVFEYLNSGVLAIGEPQLNGEITYWLNQNLRNQSIIIAGSIITSFAVFYRWIRPYLHWVALALVVMLTASLLDVRTSQDADGKGSPMATGFCSKLDAVRNAVHSKHRNIMLIVLDAVSAPVVEKVFTEDPELRGAFPGFIDFANNVGVHSRTATSMAAVMGGERFNPEGNQTPSEFVNAPLSDRSLVWEFVSNNVPCSVVWGSAVHGYSSFAPTKDIPNSDDGLYFRCRADSVPALSLFETVRFRMMPFAVKYEVLVMTLNGMRSYANVSSESLMFPILSNAKIRDDVLNNFEHYHTSGAHLPYDVDKNGNAASQSDSDKGYYEKAYFVLHQTAELMRAYQERGIYDHSMIIIMGDHGRIDALDEKAKPMLWVKPIGDSTPMTVSMVPTWSLKVNTLLRASREENLSRDQIAEILRTVDRIYQHMGWFEWDDIVDYHYDETGRVAKEVSRKCK